MKNSIRYGLGVLRTSAEYRLHRHGIRRYSYLDIAPGRTLQHGVAATEPTPPAVPAEPGTAVSEPSPTAG